MPGFTRSRARSTGIALTLVLLFALGVCATYTAFTSRYPGANDFYSRWVGGCALLQDGLNPLFGSRHLAHPGGHVRSSSASG